MEFRLILVPDCNFRCYFCMKEYYLNNHISSKVIQPHNYLYLTKIGFDSFGISEITLTGGEPLLRNDLYDIIKSIKTDYNHLTIITNGSLLDQKTQIIENINELHVSFHTFKDDHWERITGSARKYKYIVQNNIVLVRHLFPKLKIKLNVVAEKANNRREDIKNYLDFARNFDLELNIFIEGYMKWANLLGIKKGPTSNPAPWWDLSDFSTHLIHESLRKKTYLVNNVKVSLCNTSTDEQSWDSIWIGPQGEAYCDIFHMLAAISLKDVIKQHNRIGIISSIQSLIDEANYNSAIQKKIHANEDISYLRSNLAEVANFRQHNLPLIPPNYTRLVNNHGVF